jgi:hypothetical protein
MSLLRGIHLLGLVLLLLAPNAFLYIAPLLLVGALPFYLSLSACKIHREIFILFSCLVIMGCLVVAVNVLKIGTVEGIGYWILGPFVWFIIINHLVFSEQKHRLIDLVLVLAGWIVSLTNLGYVGLFLSGILGNISWPPFFSAHFGIDDRGFLAYSTSCLPQIGFLFPYFALRYIATGRGAVLLMLLGTAGLLSLRLAVIAVIVIFGLYALVRSMKFFTLKSGVFVAAGCLLVIASVLLIPEDMVQGIFELKLADKLTGGDARTEQAIFWIKSFTESPIIGHGIASTHLEIIDLASGELVQERFGSVTNPFGYEVFLLKTLSDIGLLLIPYVLLYWYLTFLLRTEALAAWMPSALRAGAIAMLLQSQTNSYLGTSGWMFIFMFPAIFAVTSRAVTSRALSLAPARVIAP